MSGTPQHKGHPTRTEARTPLRTRVKVRCDSWDRVLTLYTQNISRGGMFVRLENPPPVESEVQVQLTLPDGRGLDLTARVAHVVTPERALADGKNAGAGLSFSGVTPEQKTLLEAVIQQAQRAMADVTQKIEVPVAPPAPEVTIGNSVVAALPTDAPTLDAEEAQLLATIELELARLRGLRAWEVMGVAPDAKEEDITAAYRRLCKRYHPDVFAGGRSSVVRDSASDCFILVKKAYEKMLSDRKAGESQRKSGAPSPIAAKTPAAKSAESSRAGPLPSAPSAATPAAAPKQNPASTAKPAGFAAFAALEGKTAMAATPTASKGNPPATAAASAKPPAGASPPSAVSSAKAPSAVSPPPAVSSAKTPSGVPASPAAASAKAGSAMATPSSSASRVAPLPAAPGLSSTSALASPLGNKPSPAGQSKVAPLPSPPAAAGRPDPVPSSRGREPAHTPSSLSHADLFGDLGPSPGDPMAHAAPLESNAPLPGASSGSAKEEGLRLLEQKQYGLARTKLAEALRREPRDRTLRVAFHLCVGYDLQGQGRIDDARKQFESALSLVPNHPQALQGMKSLTEQSQKPKSTFFKKIIK